MLSETLEGRAILSGHKNGLLTLHQRKIVGRIIINSILSDNPQKKIQTVEFQALADQIVKLFTKEAAAVYFSAAIAANKFQKKKNASGILYEAYITKRRKLRELGELPLSTRSNSTLSTETSSPDTDLCDTAESPIYSDKLRWLENSVEPWTLVQDYWIDTATYRLKEINTRGAVSDYMKQYPALQQPQGYKLVRKQV